VKITGARGVLAEADADDAFRAAATAPRDRDEAEVTTGATA
jgi:hypothetical protein